MDAKQLEPVAGILVDAYLETASYSRAFKDSWGRPPTLAAKVHHLRSVAQSRIGESDQYVLGQEYMEFGRVQFVDSMTGRSYLLRSASAVSIEEAKYRLQLFDTNRFLKSDVTMIVYSFDSQALALSLAGTRQRSNRKRLEASGPAVFVGSWPYVPSDAEPFDQQTSDPFLDVGDLDMDEDEGGEIAE